LEKTCFIYLDAKNGKCTEARTIHDPSEVNPGFYAVGSYADYKEVVKGKKDFIEGVMQGVFKIKGDISKIMRHAKFIRAVANSISTFEATYLPLSPPLAGAEERQGN